VLVLGATNIPWSLDPAVRRRFEKRIYIALPETGARSRIFEIHIGNTPHTLVRENFRELAEQTEGYAVIIQAIARANAQKHPKRSDAWWCCTTLIDRACLHRRYECRYSGSDIAVVVRDALMQPVRKVQSATHFKRVVAPDPNTQEVRERLTPCSPGDPDAIAMTWEQVDGDLLLAPPVSYSDFLKAIRQTKPSVNHEDLERQEQWTHEFGSEG
jgi:vacuolar protein-sorting-associated protein 4